MKLPLSWLRDWVEVDATPEQVADTLTRRGFYVEGIESRGHAHAGVVVAKVLEVAKHPNADRLTLCRVDAGAGELSIVCGAPNVRAGMVAPLATIGAKLPGGLVIKQACSARPTSWPSPTTTPASWTCRPTSARTRGSRRAVRSTSCCRRPTRCSRWKCRSTAPTGSASPGWRAR